MNKRMPLGSLLLPPSSLSIPTSPAFPKLLNPAPSLLTGNIPHAHSLIQASRHHQVLRWMELSAHHIVIMPRQHTTEKKQHREHILSFIKLMVMIMLVRSEKMLWQTIWAFSSNLFNKILNINKLKKNVHVRRVLLVQEIYFFVLFANVKSSVLASK